MNVIKVLGKLRRDFAYTQWKITKQFFVLYMWTKRQRPAPELFDLGWRFAMGPMAKILKVPSVRWQFSREDCIFPEVLSQVGKYYPDFVAPLKVVAEPATLAELQDGQGGLVAVTHPILLAAYSCMLEKQGVVSKAITVDPDNLAITGRKLGMKAKPVHIPKDGHVFVDARARVRAGEFVINAVDFYFVRNGKETAELCVSPNFFRLSRLLQVRLFFAFAFVSPAGQLCVAFEKASSGSDEDLFAAFSAFVEKCTGTAKIWTLRKEPTPSFVPRAKPANPAWVADQSRGPLVGAGEFVCGGRPSR
jgi:hypothetical protein